MPRPFRLLLLLLVSLISTNVSCQDTNIVMRLRCYVCSSEDDASCNTARLLTSNLYRDCTGFPGSDKCLKIVGPGVLIRRYCGGIPDGNPAADGCYIQDDVQTCMCSNDYCNSGPAAVRPNSPVVLLFALALVFLAGLGTFRCGS